MFVIRQVGVVVAVGELQSSQDSSAAEVNLGGLSAPLTLNSHRTFFLSGIFQDYQSLPVNSLTSTSIYTNRKQLLQKPVPMGNIKNRVSPKTFINTLAIFLRVISNSSSFTVYSGLFHFALPSLKLIPILLLADNSLSWTKHLESMIFIDFLGWIFYLAQ